MTSYYGKDMPQSKEDWMKLFGQNREEPREIDFGYITPEMAEQLNKLLKEEFKLSQNERVSTSNKRRRLSKGKKSKP